MWIAECWVTAEAHTEWLASEPTKALIGRLVPLMVGYSERHEVTPIGLTVTQ